jgi:hypothetical protein
MPPIDWALVLTHVIGIAWLWLCALQAFGGLL